MNATAKQLLAHALELPDGERAELAAELIDSLDPGVDSDAWTAWNAEIARRVGEMDAGTISRVPWPEARRMITEHPHDPTDG